MRTGHDTKSTEFDRAEAGSSVRLERVAAVLDGFPEGHDAAVLAGAIAELAEAEVRLVAIHPDPIVVMPPGSRWRDLRADAEKLLRTTRDAVGLPLTTPIEVETDWSVGRALSRVIRRDGIDLLVLGSSRRAPSGRVKMGRVTRQLLGESASAIAVAPQGLTEHEAFTIRRIGVGYDGGKESVPALELAATVAARSAAELVVSAVVDDRLPGLGWPRGNADQTTTYWDMALAPDRDALEAKARAAVEQLNATADIRAELGSPLTILENLSSEVDLLVIGSRRWGTFARVVLGSAGEALMHGARCAVLVAPRPIRG